MDNLVPQTKVSVKGQVCCGDCSEEYVLAFSCKGR